MKPVKNKRIITKKVAEPDPNRFIHVKCRQCGEMDVAEAHYRETTFGTCSVVDVEDYVFDNYESYESDDFEITRYICRGCDRESDVGTDLFVMCDEGGHTREDYRRAQTAIRRNRQ